MLLQPWRVTLLGQLHIQQGEVTLTRFRTAKTGSLFAYLACFLNRSHPREELIERFWPESDPRDALRSLRVALTSLRHQLEPPGVQSGSVLLADRNQVRLRAEAVTTDVADFETACDLARNGAGAETQIQHLTQAVSLYRGELLPGYYDEWVLSERQRLAGRYLNALRRLVGLFEEIGQLQEALYYAGRVVQAEPLLEEAHADLIRMQIAIGHSEQAARQYLQLQRLLQQELGVQPSAATRTLVDGLLMNRREEGREQKGRRGEISSSERQPQSLPPVERPSLTPLLPLQFTRFFGRDAEIDSLLALLTEDVAYRVPGAGENTQREKGEAGEGERSEQSKIQNPKSKIDDTRHPTPDTRLITLTGPAGAGKTRLALEVAARLLDSYCDAVAFVPLAGITDTTLIASAIRDALRLERAPAGDTLQQVLAALNLRPTLLVLDNFEQLVDQGGNVVRLLLQSVPDLKLLITSRRPLNIEGEQQFPLLPLPVPERTEGEKGRKGERETKSSSSVQRLPLNTGKDTNRRSENGLSISPSPLLPFSPSRLPPSSLLSYPSIQLFMDRAQMARPDFQLTAHNAEAVAAVCWRLEGLPLAIELAAARSGVLTPQQMLKQLEDRFALLVSRRTDISDRHRTLHAAISSSYEPLPLHLQRLFARLSVFRGGCTLEAAEFVCGADEGVRGQGSGVSEELLPTSNEVQPELHNGRLQFNSLTPDPRPLPPDILDDLTELKERSLILTEEKAGEMRFWLLESLREFGEEQLTEEEREALCRRHTAYFLALAERADTFREKPEEGEWLDRLEADLDNLRIALDWTSRTEQYESNLRLTIGLSRLWQLRGYLKEGYERFRYVLPKVTQPSIERAKALYSAGTVAASIDKAETALCYLDESLQLAKQIGYHFGAGCALHSMAQLQLALSNYSQARLLLEESQTYCELAQDQVGMAWVLHSLGSIAVAQGELDAARGYYERSLALRETLQDRRGIAFSLLNIGAILIFQNRFTEARSYLERSLMLFVEIGNPWIAAMPQMYLGVISSHIGEEAYAERQLGESLETSLASEVGINVALCHLYLGDLRLRQGEYDQARERYREGLMILREIGERKRTAQGIEAFAILAQVQGYPDRAVWLFSAAYALREQLGVLLTPFDKIHNDPAIAAACAALGDNRFQQIWEAAKSHSLQEAIEVALHERPLPL